MLIDTSTATVTLGPDERVFLKDLDALKSLYVRDGWRVVVLPEVEVSVNVTRAWVADSDARNTSYTVVLLDTGTYACSCPDFQHRRINYSGPEGFCKHIIRAATGWL